ncbi:glutaredoxin-3 [Microplitis mediator]|uniref:glutaredoxin-3 n=1 Tax=Microplitis mediator TaxID=375433 RepID=UPI00255416F1|nr:glutaredoxin-3 [Microplitis mediator]
MSVSNLTTAEDFNEFLKSEELLVIHFFAPWAEQCQQINDLFDTLAEVEDFKGAKFGKVEAENLPDIAVKYKITAVPTVVLIRNSNQVDRVDGVNPALIGEKIKKYLSSKSSAPTSVETTEPVSLDERLKKLINKASCMLFMKGDRVTPRCGFSRTIVGILDSFNADYQTFDILQDNDVREGLKKFSNWPTYPQLYINGELIGGLDIVKEMNESGDLESMLPKKSTELKS